MRTNQFKQVDWIRTANVYEVNIRQYTPEGTLVAFLPELARLRDMGIQILWFMPLTPISQKNRKGILGSPYACSDYTAINPEFGTAANFTDLVIQAHSMGFKVIIDWVANHTGWDHVWTIEHPDYYKRDPVTHDFKIASGMEDIIELDYQHPGLREAMIKAMQYWVSRFDIDGFRCDLASWVEADFWLQARAVLEKTKPLFWLGEFDPLEAPAYLESFDAAYTWTWMHKTADFYSGKTNLETLKTILHQYGEICSNGNMPLWFTSNHDENSWNGTEYEKYGKMTRSLAVFSFTWNGLPLVYSGQEAPNTKRLEFFEKDTIAWGNSFTLHEFYKILLSLKKRNPALQGGDKNSHIYELEIPVNMQCLGYSRKCGKDEVLVLLNWGNERISLQPDTSLFSCTWYDVFEGREVQFSAGKDIELEPWEFLVLEKYT